MLTAAPIQMQIAAGIGFLAYLTATAGLRERHRPVEITGWTLMFSAVFLAALPVAQAWVPERWSMWAAAGLTFLLAILWRAVGHRLVSRIGAKLKISRAIQYPSVRSWLLDHHPAFTQIGVVLKDGTEIRSMNVQEHWDGFLRAPVMLAADGSIALVADSIEHPGHETTPLEKSYVHNQDWGDMLTVIPGDQIAWYWVRVKKPL